MFDLRVEPDAACGTTLLGPGTRHILHTRQQQQQQQQQQPYMSKVTQGLCQLVWHHSAETAADMHM
jgi:hypothetical protein